MISALIMRHWLSLITHCFLGIFLLMTLSQTSEANEREIGAWAYLDRAIEKAAAGNHVAALRDISKALATNPELPEAYLLRGISQAGMGRYSDAIRAYTKAIRLKPNYTAAFLNRGQAHGMLGNYAGQLEDSSQAIQLAPAYAEAFINRGLAKAKLQDLKGAYDDYSQAIRLKPKSAFAYYCRGIAKAKLGEGRGAIVDITHALKEGARQSIQDFSAAIEQNPADPDWYIARGLSFLVLKNKELASKDFEMAIRVDPKLKQVLNQLRLY